MAIAQTTGGWFVRHIATVLFIRTKNELKICRVEDRQFAGFNAKCKRVDKGSRITIHSLRRHGTICVLPLRGTACRNFIEYVPKSTADLLRVGCAFSFHWDCAEQHECGSNCFLKHREEKMTQSFCFLFGACQLKDKIRCTWGLCINGKPF